MDNHKFLPKAKVVGRMEYLANLARGKKVLNIGMGGFIDNAEYTTQVLGTIGDTLQGKLSAVASHVTGIDINPMSLKIMSEALPEGRYIETDVSAPNAVELIDDKFELIVFGDVIEHLDCFRAALNNLRNLLTDDGVLIITTANAYNIEAILKYVFRYESVHEEHTCYFSYMTMKRLLAMNDLKLTNFGYTIQTRSGGGLASRIGYLALRVIAAIMPHFAQGILVHAEAA